MPWILSLPSVVNLIHKILIGLFREERIQRNPHRKASQFQIENSSQNIKNLEFLKEFKGSIKERFLSSSNIEELKAVDVSVGPLIPTRCKSELARTGEKLDPNSNFWKTRGLGLTGSHSQPVL